jgi:hypothetical protein
MRQHSTFIIQHSSLTIANIFTKITQNHTNCNYTKRVLTIFSKYKGVAPIRTRMTQIGYFQFSEIAQALATKLKTKGKFTYLDTGGQDCVIGYHTKEELQKIRKVTRLDIAWIDTN